VGAEDLPLLRHGGSVEGPSGRAVGKRGQPSGPAGRRQLEAANPSSGTPLEVVAVEEEVLDDGLPLPVPLVVGTCVGMGVGGGGGKDGGS
jgi:hypothetical protein